MDGHLDDDIVVDASVGTNWVLLQDHRTSSARLLSGAYRLHVPVFFRTELSSAIVKAQRQRVLDHDEVSAAVRNIGSLNLVVHDAFRVLQDAVDAALTTGISVYDASYLAIAQHLGCRVVTADRKFFDRAAERWPERMMWVEELEPIAD